MLIERLTAIRARGLDHALARQIHQNRFLLRLLVSVRLGTVTASRILRKLAAYPRQNGLAVAPRDVGRSEGTLYKLLIPRPADASSLSVQFSRIDLATPGKRKNGARRAPVAWR